MAAFETRQRFGALDGVKRHWARHTEDVRPMALQSSHAAMPHREGFSPDSMRCLVAAYGREDSGRLAQYSPVAQTRAADPLSRSMQSQCLETILMPRLLEGSKIGLAIDRLEVNDILDPMAAACGFRVGDRMIAVNGVPVTTQDEFRVALQFAISEHYTRRTPLKFQVYNDSRGQWYCENDFTSSLTSSPCRRQDRSGMLCGPEEDYVAQDQRRSTHFQNYPPGNAVLAPAEMNYHACRSYSQLPMADMASPGYPGGMDVNGYSRRSRDTWAC